MESKTVSIEISNKTIFRIFLWVVGIVVVFFLVNKLLGLIIILVVAYIISAALRPTINFLTSKGLHHDAMVVLVHISFLLIVLLTLGFIFVPVGNELKDFMANTDMGVFIKDTVQRFDFLFNALNKVGIKTSASELSAEITDYVNNSGGLVGNLVQGGVGVANTILDVVLTLLAVFMFSIYISMSYDDGVISFLNLIKDVKRRKQVNDLIRTINVKLGYWIQGQLMLSAIIFLCVFILLTFLRIPLALPLALLAGFLESFPNIGPTISLIPSLTIAIARGNPYQIIGVVIGYIVIQILENYLIVPKVMSKSVNLPAFGVLVAISVGSALLGPLGVVLAVPLAAVVKILIESQFEKQASKEK